MLPAGRTFQPFLFGDAINVSGALMPVALGGFNFDFDFDFDSPDTLTLLLLCSDAWTLTGRVLALVHSTARGVWRTKRSEFIAAGKASVNCFPPIG